MADSERVLVNRFDGSIVRYGESENVHEMDIKKRVAAFKARLVGLGRWAEEHKCKVYFLTLTLKSPDCSVRILNRFLNFLRARFARANLPFKYCWVLELQEKRYEETGMFAKHWHIAIACPLGSLPDVEYLKNKPIGKRYHLKSDGFVVKQKELFKFWGYGQELCSIAYGSLVGYLAKY